MKSKLIPIFSLILLINLGLASRLQASSVTVNTEQDSIDQPECTLRDAIRSVNDDAAFGGCQAVGDGVLDTIELPAGNYVLSIPGSEEDGNDQGDLDIFANLTLNGAGSGNTTVSASGLQPDNPDRVFDINPFGNSDLTVTFNGVTIRDGEEFWGGGIQIQGEQPEVISFLKNGDFGSTVSVVLNDVVVTENEAFFSGGGINNSGADLTLNNSQVTLNNVDVLGGGIAQGGRCFKCNNLSLLVLNSGGLLTLQNTTVSSNTTQVVGGGIYNQTELVMDSSTVSGNTAGNNGGGIFNNFGTLSLITNSTISGNQALGEAIDAIQFPELKLGSLSGDGFGGGIFQNPGELVLVNSTVSGNSALTSGGGIALIAEFARLATPNLKLGTGSSIDFGLFNVTIADNTATDSVGGGVFVFIDQPSDLKAGGFAFQSMVANTLIADNNALQGGEDCVGNFTSLGYNLIGTIDDNCTGFGGTGDQTDIDPLLGPLQGNGGPTQTQGLLQGSPAIDTANPDGCLDEDGLPLNRDQRNFVRPVNATGLATAICDIGAYEVGGAVLRVLKTDSTDGQSVSIGSNFDYTITITNEGPNLASDVQLSDPLPSQVDFVGPITTTQGTCSNAGDTINCDLDDIPVGTTVTVGFTVTAVAASTTVVNTVTVTTTTKDFDNGGVYTSTVTTAVGGTGRLEGSGCGFQLIPGPVNAPLAMLWPLALGLGLWLRMRTRRR